MVKGNLKSFELKTIDECEDRLSLARDCLNRSKDGAAEAAGVSYMLHRACEGGEPAKWLTAQIEARNIEIKKHNDDLSDLFKRAKDFMDGKLSKEDHLNKKPADDAEKKVHDAERSELRRISGLSIKEKNKIPVFSLRRAKGPANIPNWSNSSSSSTRISMPEWFLVIALRWNGSGQNLINPLTWKLMISKN